MGAGQQIVRKFPNGSSDMIEPMKPSKRHARFNKCVMALLLYLLKISGQNHKAETAGLFKGKDSLLLDFARRNSIFWFYRF